jgi:hypothetical protein
MASKRAGVCDRAGRSWSGWMVWSGPCIVWARRRREAVSVLSVQPKAKARVAAWPMALGCRRFGRLLFLACSRFLPGRAWSCLFLALGYTLALAYSMPIITFVSLTLTLTLTHPHFLCLLLSHLLIPSPSLFLPSSLSPPPPTRNNPPPHPHTRAAHT